MTCTRHGGNDVGSLLCRECDLEVIERHEAIEDAIERGRLGPNDRPKTPPHEDTSEKT